MRFRSHADVAMKLDVADDNTSEKIAMQLNDLMKDLSVEESSSHGLTSGSVSVKTRKKIE